MSASTTWLVNPANPLLFAAWPDEEWVVVYQPASGDTHLISTVGVAVLELLHQPLGAVAVFKALFPDDEPVKSAVATLRSNFLIHFEQLGLIQKSLS